MNHVEMGQVEQRVSTDRFGKGTVCPAVADSERGPAVNVLRGSRMNFIHDNVAGSDMPERTVKKTVTSPPSRQTSVRVLDCTSGFRHSHVPFACLDFSA